MKVLFLSPGYPSEMPHFVRGLSEVGAAVLGVGDQLEIEKFWLARKKRIIECEFTKQF